MNPITARPAARFRASVVHMLITAAGSLGALALGACSADTALAPDAATATPAAPTSALVYSWCTPMRAHPDLIVTDMETVGAAVTVDATHARVFVRATVKNVGAGCANKFRIEPHQWAGDAYIAANWDVYSGELSSVDSHGFTTYPLQSGQSFPISGWITVIRNLPQETHAAVRLRADACDYVDEEFLPAHCRVFESNETNNNSAWVLFPFP